MFIDDRDNELLKAIQEVDHTGSIIATMVAVTVLLCAFVLIASQIISLVAN